MMFVLNGDFCSETQRYPSRDRPTSSSQNLFCDPKIKQKPQTNMCIYIWYTYIYISDKEKHQEVDDGDEGFLVFPPIFCFLETSLRNSQDSPVRLGIMDFLPFSFEAAGLLVVCWWILDVCSWRFLGSCGLFHLHSGNLPGPSKGCQMDGKGFWMSCLT